jgi:pimeloyl-ACP methyl ester carboxylesterase
MLNYTRHGKGRALVLLHGFLGGTAYWVPTVSGLHPVHDVIAVDLPGFAGSSKIPAPDSLNGYARMVVDLLVSLQVKTFSLLGFSMGGMIAQEVALAFPTSVEKLILYGSETSRTALNLGRPRSSVLSATVWSPPQIGPPPPGSSRGKRTRSTTPAAKPVVGPTRHPALP